MSNVPFLEHFRVSPLDKALFLCLAENLSIQGVPSRAWSGSGIRSQVSGGNAARAAHFRLRRRSRLRPFPRMFSPSRWMLRATTERPTASSNQSGPRSRTLSNPQCSGLLCARSEGGTALPASPRPRRPLRSRSKVPGCRPATSG